MRRALAVAIILVLCSAGCTSSNLASASPFAVQVSGTVGPKDSPSNNPIGQDIVIPHDGNVTITLTWTNSASSVSLVITQSGCGSPFLATCKNFTGVGGGTQMSRFTTLTASAGPPQLTAWVYVFNGPSTPYTLRIEVK